MPVGSRKGESQNFIKSYLAARATSIMHRSLSGTAGPGLSRPSRGGHSSHSSHRGWCNPAELRYRPLDPGSQCGARGVGRFQTATWWTSCTQYPTSVMTTPPLEEFPRTDARARGLSAFAGIRIPVPSGPGGLEFGSAWNWPLPRERRPFAARSPTSCPQQRHALNDLWLYAGFVAPAIPRQSSLAVDDRNQCR